jgi:tetratricopeptide (TPR) repeat protein
MAAYQEIIRRNPDHYNFQVGLADFALDVRDLDASYISAAHGALDAAEAASPSRQPTAYARARLLYAEGRIAEALEVLRLAVEADPLIADSHFYYGLFLLESGNFNDGKRAIEEAGRLGRGPRNGNQASILGGHFGDAGEYAAAVRYYEQALAFEPGNEEFKMKLGLVYYFDKRFGDAKRLIGEVMQSQDLIKSPQYEALRPILKELGLE